MGVSGICSCTSFVPQRAMVAPRPLTVSASSAGPNHVDNWYLRVVFFYCAGECGYRRSDRLSKLNWSLYCSMRAGLSPSIANHRKRVSDCRLSLRVSCSLRWDERPNCQNRGDPGECTLRSKVDTDFASNDPRPIRGPFAHRLAGDLGPGRSATRPRPQEERQPIGQRGQTLSTGGQR